MSPSATLSSSTSTPSSSSASQSTSTLTSSSHPTAPRLRQNKALPTSSDLDEAEEDENLDKLLELPSAGRSPSGSSSTRHRRYSMQEVSSGATQSFSSPSAQPPTGVQDASTMHSNSQQQQPLHTPLAPPTRATSAPNLPNLALSSSSSSAMPPPLHAPTPRPMIRPILKTSSTNLASQGWNLNADDLSSNASTTSSAPSSPPKTTTPTLTSSSSTTSLGSLSTTPLRRSDSAKSLTFGQRLEHVCLFSSSDMPMEISKSPVYEVVEPFPSLFGGVKDSASSDEDDDDDDDDTDRGSKGELWFSTKKSTVQPPPPAPWAIVTRTASNTTSISSGANIALDTIRVDTSSYSQQYQSKSPSAGDTSLCGTILVRNLGFEKDVFVRMTADEWRSNKDVKATWGGTVVPGGDSGIERFTFRVGVDGVVNGRGKDGEEVKVEMAVGCRMAGGEFWDNNRGMNHSLILKRDAGLNERGRSYPSQYASNGSNASQSGRSMSFPSFSSSSMYSWGWEASRNNGKRPAQPIPKETSEAAAAAAAASAAAIAAEVARMGRSGSAPAVVSAPAAAAISGSGSLATGGVSAGSGSPLVRSKGLVGSRSSSSPNLTAMALAASAQPVTSSTGRIPERKAWMDGDGDGSGSGSDTETDSGNESGGEDDLVKVKTVTNGVGSSGATTEGTKSYGYRVVPHTISTSMFSGSLDGKDESERTPTMPSFSGAAAAFASPSTPTQASVDMMMSGRASPRHSMSPSHSPVRAVPYTLGSVPGSLGSPWGEANGGLGQWGYSANLTVMPPNVAASANLGSGVGSLGGM
ncbi:hypothetical protein HDU97_006813, partial [Phlyctochytrium planicorne]